MGVWTKQTRYTYPDKPPYHVFVERRCRMPRLPAWVTDCSVYFYQDPKSASGGVGRGGCGFIALVPGDASEPLRAADWSNPHRTNRANWSRFFAYAVTNWHVAKAFPVMRLNCLDGRARPVQLENWHKHPSSDIAVAPLDLDPNAYRLTAVPLDMVLDKDSAEYLEVGLGDEVFIMSRFLRHDGKRTNHPAARGGMISVMPREDEPIGINDIGKQVAFLIEVRTIPGASGSPVFLYIPGSDQRDTERNSPRRDLYEVAQGDRLFNRSEAGPSPGNEQELELPTPPLVALLGISGGYMYSKNEDVVGPNEQKSGLKVPLHSGMGWCVPSWKLLELLNCDALKAQREALRQEWRETPPSGAPC